MINRKEMKRRARAAMGGRSPSVYVVTFIYFVIIVALTILDIGVNTGGNFLAYLEGEYIEPGLFGTIVLLGISVMNLVIGVGYTWYCLCVSRGMPAGYGELFDGFGIFFQLILLQILTALYLLIWYILVALSCMFTFFVADTIDNVLVDIICMVVVLGSVTLLIMAAYRYSFAVFILMDDPDKGPVQCLRESSNMTFGHKGKLFMLDLSFIGWMLLSVIPGVMIFVMPYTQVTLSNYYNYLSGWKPETPALPDPEIEI